MMPTQAVHLFHIKRVVVVVPQHSRRQHLFEHTTPLRLPQGEVGFAYSTTIEKGNIYINIDRCHFAQPYCLQIPFPIAYYAQVFII